MKPMDTSAGPSPQPMASISSSHTEPGTTESTAGTVALSRPIEEGNIQTAAAAALGAAAVKSKVHVDASLNTLDFVLEGCISQYIRLGIGGMHLSIHLKIFV